MNSTFSTIILVMAVILGFLLRGCFATQEIVSPQNVLVVDSSATGALIVCRDSVASLLTQVDRLKANGVKIVTKTFVVHDTIESSPQIVTEIKTVFKTDSFYTNQGLKPQTATFQNEHLLARVTIGEKLATLDSLVVYDSTQVIQNEIALGKYQVQRSAIFKRSNPYLTKSDNVYLEVPRYTDFGISHLQKKSKQKGLFWGIVAGSAAATTYFLIKK